jgi:hypothetical protein
MRSVLREGSPVASKYEFIETMRLDTAEYVFSVEYMCDRLDVSKSGYYEWRNRPDSATAQRRENLKLLIKKAFDMSDSTYGYRRIHAQLTRWGHAAGLELVRRLMRELGLVACQPKPKRFGLTRAAAGDVPDLVGRNFTADAPGGKLVGDIRQDRGRLAVSGDRYRLLHQGSHRLRHGRPLPDPSHIPGHPQRGTKPETRQGRDIPLRSRQQLHVG